MTSFTDEDALQGLVAESPELLGSSEPVAWSVVHGPASGVG